MHLDQTRAAPARPFVSTERSPRHSNHHHHHHLLRTEGIASLLLTAASPRRPPVHRVCLVFEPACLHISCATPIVGFTPLLPKSAQLFPSLALNFDFKHNKGCIPTDSTVGSLGIVGHKQPHFSGDERERRTQGSTTGTEAPQQAKAQATRVPLDPSSRFPTF